MIRVVIADDHLIVREGLKFIIGRTDDMEVAGEAVDGFEALSYVRNGGFDILLLDLSMPGRSGIELVRQIKDEEPKLPVVVLTMHDEDQYAVRAIRAGARAYLTKKTPGPDLLSVIRSAAAGHRCFTGKIAELLVDDIAADSEGLPHKQLSNREFEIMKLLVTGKPIVEIAQELHLSAKTISTHKTRILGKMRMRTLAELIQYAMMHKLVETPGN